MKLKIKLKNVEQPDFVAGHCTQRGTNRTKSREELVAMFEADGIMEYIVEGSHFQNMTAGIETYDRVSCCIIDMETSMLISRHKWDDLPNIRYQNVEDHIAVDPATGEPVPPRDWLVDTIDFQKASAKEQEEFLKALGEKGNLLDKSINIEPKKGDWARVLMPHLRRAEQVIENKEINFEEAVKQCISHLKSTSCDETLFEIRYGVIDRVDKERDRVEIGSWFSKYEVLDPLTGQAKCKDVALIREGITELLEFCSKNNYHEIDEDLRGITW